MATIQELESFKMSDAVKFHNELNPNLWINNKLDPKVREQLLLIADDFITTLGIPNLDIVDITVSGSNAAYSYTQHSDLDLHVLVDMAKLRDNEVYRELFTAKKTLYNDAHNITVHGVPVELYVQDIAIPVKSLGEYSVLNDKWIRIPKKQRANFDQAATKAKFDNLAEIIILALNTRTLSRVEKAIDTIKRYRQAGLDKGGEFSPENLAYKAIRTQGGIDALYDLRDELHSEELTIEEAGMDEDYDPNGPPPGPEFKPTMPKGTVRVDVSDVYDWYKLGQHVSNLKGLGKHDFGKGPPSTILSFGDEETEHKYIKDLEKTGLTTTDIDPLDPNQPKGMKRQKTDPTFKVDEAMDRDSAIRQIFKLKSTQGRSPSEIETAQKIINNLIQKFNINPKEIGISPTTPSSPKVSSDLTPQERLKTKIAKAEYERHQAAGALKGEWEKFKRNLFAESEALDEDFTSKQQVINYFVSRGKTAAQGAAAWERGWRGSKPKQAKPYEPERYTNVRLPYIDEAESDAKKAPTIQFKTWERRGIPRHSFKVTFNGKDIAFGEVEKDNEWDDDRGASVQEIVVNHAYRRKGIATKIYDAIESKFNYKLHPSDDVKPDGQEFWKSRSNMDEADEALDITFTQEPYEGWNGMGAMITAYSDGDQVGQVIFEPTDNDKNKWYATEVEVEDEFQRKGIATTMYDMAKKIAQKANAVIVPSHAQTSDAKGLWKDKKIWEASDYKQHENEIEDFVQSLNPDDVGVEQIGPYHVHFEGFTDECQQDAERRCNLPSDNPRHLANYDDVYKEVIRDFVRREAGKKPLKVGLAGYQDYPVIYAVFDNPKPYKNPDAWNPKIDEASGYIPSAKEKNDPRFKTALTVDVGPDAIKKNAKAFGFKTSRAGIPPQARADGKIAEDLMRQYKEFLGEQQEEMFPGYDEQHREKRLSNWLAKSWGVKGGKPQTFYHATTKDFDTFNMHGTGFASALGMAYEVDRHGSFFAVDPKFAEGFIEDPNTGRVKEGGRVLPVHLSIQSPIDLRDDALSRMLSDEETREEFKANNIDLNSIYSHMYELERWELFDGPEGAEFVENLQKLGFDGAIINESIPDNSNAKSGQVWVAFNPSQVKSVYNRGSFSPDDPRLTKESG